MKCEKCGANYGSELVKCPYCGEINKAAEKLSSVLNEHVEDYQKTEKALTEKGSSKALKYITIGMIVLYIVIYILTTLIVFGINKVVTGESSLVKNSTVQKKNEELFVEYMSKGQYARALTLVNQTDLSMYADKLTGFEYYKDYADSLEAIFPYVNIYNEVLFILDDMENGNDYRALTDTQVISYHIFYTTKDTELKKELQTEIEGYLKNLYRLTDEEIEQLRTCEYEQDFRIEGSKDYEAITKERMVEYFGK